MIEVENSKAGLPIIKVNGLRLNSLYDPAGEATAWVQKLAFLEKDFQSIVLMGIGSLHHCLAFLNAFPKKNILIVETDLSLIQKSIELIPELQKCQIYHFIDARLFFNSKQGREITCGLFHIVRTPSSYIANANAFDEIETVLTGRSSYGFENYCELRPKYKKHIDFSKINKSKLVSISEISEAFKLNPQLLSPEQRVLHILEELIK